MTAAPRLALPFEQQAQRGGINFGNRGEIDHEIAAAKMLFAGLAQRRSIGDGERAAQAQLIAVAFDHFLADCRWDSVLFLVDNVAIKPSIPPFWISVLKVLR